MAKVCFFTVMWKQLRPSAWDQWRVLPYAPQQRELTRYAQFRIPNPWGIAFDDFGQDFFLHTSGTSLSWMRAGAIKAVYGSNLQPQISSSQMLSPHVWTEFVSSRHFLDEVQGDILLNNAIGFLGAKQHQGH